MKMYIKNGVITLQNKIVIEKEDRNIFNPIEEMLLEYGWVEYIPPVIDITPLEPKKDSFIIM